MSRLVFLKCEACDKEFAWTAGGRPPQFCWDHRPAKNRLRDIARLKAKADADPNSPAAALLGAATDAEDRDDRHEAERAMAPQLIACAMSLTDDVDAAVAMVGLSGLDPDEIKAAVQTAREKHADLTEGSVGATVKVMSALLPILGMRAIANSRKMTPSTAGAAARSFAQVVEALSGGPKPVYSGAITLNIETKAKAKS